MLPEKQNTYVLSHSDLLNQAFWVCQEDLPYQLQYLPCRLSHIFNRTRRFQKEVDHDQA